MPALSRDFTFPLPALTRRSPSASTSVKVKGPRGTTCWYNAWELAPSARSQTKVDAPEELVSAAPAPAPAPAPAVAGSNGAGAPRPTVNDRVKLVAGAAAAGCLRPGEVGVIVTDDRSEQPWNVRGRESVLAVCVYAMHVLCVYVCAPMDSTGLDKLVRVRPYTN